MISKMSHHALITTLLSFSASNISFIPVASASGIFASTSTPRRRTAQLMPYGFQSGFDPSPSDSETSTYGNDDSYAGSIAIDRENGVLYLTGGTYGYFFDGSESNPPSDSLHLQQSECFVSVLKLPQPIESNRRKTSSVRPIDVATVPDPYTQPQLLYTRRFGTESNPEVCSAVQYLKDPNSDDNLQRKIVSIGHTEGQKGLFTTLRRSGSDLSTVYGFVMDFDVNLNLDYQQKESNPTNGTLNGGMLFHESKVQYPVALVSGPMKNDATSEIYVLMMESDSDAINSMYTETLEKMEGNNSNHMHPDLTAGGGGGLQMYGTIFDLTIKKLSWKSDAILATEAATTEGIKRMLKEGWSRTYSPDDDESVLASSLLYMPGSSPSEDVLVIAGSTRGTGEEFGAIDTDGKDLDGFVSKMDPSTGQFLPATFSSRIKSQNNKEDWAMSLCMKENSPGLKEFYVVGFTGGVLDGVDPFETAGSGRQAFIMKMDLDSLAPIWTKQLGPNSQNGDVKGFGCAVTPDGNEVYLSGIVKNGSGIQGSENLSTAGEGGDDVFIAKYEASGGKLQFLRQLGTSEKETLARGGGITVDSEGNAILMGTTNGSLMRYRGKKNRRRRTADEVFNHNYNAADVFVMSVSRETGEHRTPMEQVAGGAAHTSMPSLPNRSSGTHSSNETALSIVGLTLIIMFSCGLVAFALFVGYKFYQKRMSDRDFLSHNLDLAKHLEDFEDVEVEIRHSATGGVHGMYHFEEKNKKDDSTDRTSFSSVISPTDPRLRSSRLLKESMFMDDEDEQVYDLTSETADTADDQYDGDVVDDDEDDVDYKVGRQRSKSFMRSKRKASYRGLVDSYDTIWKDCAQIADPDAPDGPKTPPQHAFHTKAMEETKPLAEDNENFRIT